MSQILNIFRKDTRRFWPEIVLSLAIVAALAWIGPYEWKVEPHEHPELEALRQLAGLLAFLMIVGWVLLASRAVHAEPLVGDRQFWLTRPYEWKKLLAAKTLFLAAYLYLPFLLMQCVLLARAGFAPVHWIPELLFNLLLVSAAIILPLVAAAAISSNFGRMALILVGTLLCLWLLVVAYQMMHFNSAPNNNADTPIGNLLSYGLAFAVCGVAIVVQYSARRVRVAVLLLVGVSVCIILLFLFAPDRMLTGRSHPQAGPAFPIQLSSDYSGGSTSRSGWSNSSQIGTTVPLRISGLADGDAVLFDDVKFTFQAANGSHWASSWQHLDHFGDNQGHAGVLLVMPQAVYNQFSGIPFQVHLTVAFTQARITKVTQISVSSQEFSVPDFGYCKLRSWRGADGGHHDDFLSCRSPLQLPLTQIASSWTYRQCTPRAGAVPTESTEVGYRFAGSDNVLATDLSLVPINFQNYGFANVESQNSVAMCPVSLSATFTEYKPIRRMQESVDVQDFRLTLPPPEELGK
jgi:hypothetical protein